LRLRWVMRGYQGRVDKPARRIHQRDVRRMRCAYPPYRKALRLWRLHSHRRSNHHPLPEGRIGLRPRWVMRGYQGRVDKPARRIHQRDVRRMRCAYPPSTGMPGARLHAPSPTGVPRGHKGEGRGEGGRSACWPGMITRDIDVRLVVPWLQHLMRAAMVVGSCCRHAWKIDACFRTQGPRGAD